MRRKAPAQFAYVPKQLSMWGNDQYGDCVSAEEAFAKACYSPEIFIDDQRKIPVRYAAYFWPQKAGDAELPVLEEYTYLNVKLGLTGAPILTDADFDSENPAYNF